MVKEVLRNGEINLCPAELRAASIKLTALFRFGDVALSTSIQTLFKDLPDDHAC